MTTTAITLVEWNLSKFRGVPVTQTALDLINKSEILKGDIRAYQSSNADDVKLLTAAKEIDSGSYAPPTVTSGGLLSVGINRVNTPEGTFNILAHELGHFKVEALGAPIASARESARTAGSEARYEAACNLTEGLAKLNEVNAREEVAIAIQQQAIAQGRAITASEQVLIDKWLGQGAFINGAETESSIQSRKPPTWVVVCQPRTSTMQPLLPWVKTTRATRLQLQLKHTFCFAAVRPTT